MDFRILRMMFNNYLNRLILGPFFSDLKLKFLYFLYVSLKLLINSFFIFVILLLVFIYFIIIIFIKVSLLNKLNCSHLFSSISRYKLYPASYESMHFIVQHSCEIGIHFKPLAFYLNSDFEHFHAYFFFIFSFLLTKILNSKIHN